MNQIESLKVQIEKERRKLEEMLSTMSLTMEDVLTQSRELDRLMEEYIGLTN
ncbi:Spo0E like sporulation regulatory protein [Marvinbryantia formatexigens DSM 14469]|uniref:Spo0E like sporulation regulatory protein n=1 Tax=Marvinbryantia formatexigens DSM 14469 TaxID=478749 RepID=C6LGZ8_9FIRM|nr:aspartyl-phosphate phosphatase Spo0E family protein [Marvinbryantia formatexigens]EET60057.1 Spo0E like sporulation regulatory protein [Marvinbryantia formatexigens DSM 14469]UWO23853.1 aspartyl-phosphate phosphatase Spo0E family protein [Marvinbryantia formatexigens DSM 14469]SDG50475.1 Spo0E like sporulation regulatory protein [Marvinbryantia formatexigens]